jgi:hypothetical protein
MRIQPANGPRFMPFPQSQMRKLGLSQRHASQRSQSSLRSLQFPIPLKPKDPTLTAEVGHTTGSAFLNQDEPPAKGQPLPPARASRVIRNTPAPSGPLDLQDIRIGCVVNVPIRTRRDTYPGQPPGGLQRSTEER